MKEGGLLEKQLRQQKLADMKAYLWIVSSTRLSFVEHSNQVLTLESQQLEVPLAVIPFLSPSFPCTLFLQPLRLLLSRQHSVGLEPSHGLHYTYRVLHHPSF